MKRVNIDTSHRLLNSMGITQWLPKAAHESLLNTLQPLFCATCLILLPENPERMNDQQYKMFTGMHKVLGLDEAELGVAWLSDPFTLEHPSSLKNEIAKWAPYTLLIMGKDLANHVLSTNLPIEDLRVRHHAVSEVNTWVQITYHPQELQIATEHKAKAYRDLLDLKEKIALMRAI